MKPPRVLVAGIGNIFLGDDAFGVEVAQKLLLRRFPEEVHVVDFGIRGIDLTYALADGPEYAVLIDRRSTRGANRHGSFSRTRSERIVRPGCGRSSSKAIRCIRAQSPANSGGNGRASWPRVHRRVRA